MADIVNILHLSDLHFSRKKNVHDQSIVLDALKEDLRQISDSIYKPDIIIFSGDLVQAADEESVYYELYDELLEPISTITRCPINRFIICPGNHDAGRNALDKHHHLQDGLVGNLSCRDSLNNAYINGELAALVNEKFAHFNEIKPLFALPDTESDGIVQVYHFPELGSMPLDIVCFNTAWVTYAGKVTDKDKLLLPEAAITR